MVSGGGEPAPGVSGGVPERLVPPPQSRRALRVQVLARLPIVVLLLVQLLRFPPHEHEVACAVLVAGYAIWSLLLVEVAWSDRWSGRWTYHFLWLDLLVLGLLLVLSQGFASPVGGRPLVDDAFFLVPVLAAFQMRPRVTGEMSCATAFAYLLTLGLSRGELGWASVVLHVLGLLLVGAVCTALTWVQSERVRTVEKLVEQSHALLGQAMDAEERERRNLAEALHDQALQNVLAARHDVDEGRSPEYRQEALGRADLALADAARQMRSIVSELHPAVLKELGLVQAVQSLVASASSRGRFDVRVEAGAVPRFSLEPLAFDAVRELLGNIVKHARAQHVLIGLHAADGRVTMVLEDDGVGLGPGAMTESVRRGHIGLASLRVRVESAGGTLQLDPREPSGTRARVVLPLMPASR
ncbi:sensor histidine kinase [Streptomyces sp. NPDC006879]|uniref:sensor histidine kinase n=1 Tax=Streptomyces sp. NPDC006879 TaxID=3364767 RepID=UPI00367E8D29